MQKNYAPYSIGLAQARSTLQKVINEAGDDPIALMDRNNIRAYIVPVKTYERLIERANKNLDTKCIGLQT